MPTDTVTLAVLDALKWRYATKKFDPSQKIPQSTWNQLEEALRLSPSSFGLQPYRFVVVTNQDVKQELVGAAWNQRQIADCSHLVVFSRLKELTLEYVDHYVDIIAETRNVPSDSLQAMKDMMTGFVKNTSQEELSSWMAKQAYIALGNLMTVASTLGIDNCPMEGFAREEFDRILDLPARGCHSVVLCALGYRSADDKYEKLTKVRFPADELFIRKA
jgi:nitroreductase